jgi:hypothetical protein
MMRIHSHKGNADYINTETPFQPIQNGCHQENKQQQMLPRMYWEKICNGRKEHLHTLGMNIMSSYCGYQYGIYSRG